uniref:NADH-ubiquinone oxidoreductase chain 2 n=1 Tax=Tenebrionoidea sp. 9 KM-2017 TaxID=2219487 RepID=A0A346RKG4_9CUCU|nr:NADH dehydrogenase subunit 2 [Tenebrionoidea sp. 9 KM-2017]
MSKLYKIIFFSTMLMGTIVSISSYSWMSMWMGLEINLLSIIPLFSSSKNIYSSESSLKYFITQAMASLVLLFSIIMMLSSTEFITEKLNLTFSMMMNSALLTKIGAAPFHFWFPEVIEGLNWINSMILLTWQKIAPMVLMMNNLPSEDFLFCIIIMSLMISTMMGINQVSLRKILAFSSINHIAWMIAAMMISCSNWLVYFIIYSIININIIMIFMMTNSYFIKQIMMSLNLNKPLKLILMLNFFSLGGLPPFIGFLPKWLTINWLITNNFFMITFLLIVFTLIMLYIYTRLMFSILVFSFSESMVYSNQIKNKTFLIMSAFFLSSLILCTLMFNML